MVTRRMIAGLFAACAIAASAAFAAVSNAPPGVKLPDFTPKPPPPDTSLEGVNFTFATPPVSPKAGVPAEALRAGVEPGGRVTDSSDHGPLSRLVEGRLASVQITWANSQLLPKQKDAEEYLRRLLTTGAGNSRTFMLWSRSMGVPSLAATVEHLKGKPGQLSVWYNWPSVYFAYLDGEGKWWFGTWGNASAVKLPMAKPEPKPSEKVTTDKTTEVTR